MISWVWEPIDLLSALKSGYSAILVQPYMVMAALVRQHVSTNRPCTAAYEHNRPCALVPSPWIRYACKAVYRRRAGMNLVDALMKTG